MSRLRGYRWALLATVLPLGMFPAIPGQSAAPAVSLPSPTALSSILTATRRPPRDLYAFTARLKLHTTTPINPYVNPTPTDYPVGHVDTFYIDKGSTVSGFTIHTASIRLKTAHAYFYVENGMQLNMSKLAQSAQVFEQHTYPTDHALFGNEWTPGVDNDQHITIFNGNLPPGEGGSFSAEDLYPRSVNPFSNQRKIVYMNLGAEIPGTSGYDSVLAHELQHMIHFNMHRADEAWINEGSSVLAQKLNGYFIGDDAAKAAEPNTQLDAWVADLGQSAPYYGGGYLWMLYLYEHFGGAKATRTVLADSGLSNMALFDDALAKLGSPKRADDVFADWVIANLLNDRTLLDGRYGYTHSTIKSVLTDTLKLPFSRLATMHQYAANYLDIAHTGGGPFTLHFKGQPTVPLIGTVAPAQGFWWSNRADNVDTTLTLPPLDLQGLHHASLHYQAWWDLETDYDYGYVEVSADGGKTWYAQRTAHTTNRNPNGANVGDGYTGSSCSAASTAQHCWVDESLDLSTYAGKRVLVRFEMVTDDTYNGQGLAITHLRVPEVGFDGDSTATGWQPAGWVRAGNLLTERWIVQAVEYRASGISVVPLVVGADGLGSLAVPAGTTRVVVAVSPVAPLTTLTNSYTLSGA